jgi:hypothetical protein
MSDRDHFSYFQETNSQFQEKNPISTELPSVCNMETNKNSVYHVKKLPILPGAFFPKTPEKALF